MFHSGREQIHTPEYRIAGTCAGHAQHNRRRGSHPDGLRALYLTRFPGDAERLGRPLFVRVAGANIRGGQSFGTFQRAGVEGTGTYGAGIARFLSQQGVQVFEINRPDRSMRHFRGKLDPTDAESGTTKF
jgi:transposase